MTSPRPRPDVPPDLVLWYRIVGFAPWWAWAAAVAVLVGATLPFWLYQTPAPFHDLHGDVYRGWPVVYGLDQGDVGGDDWGPFTAYFRPDAFAQDTALGAACGVPVAGLIVWIGRRAVRRNQPESCLPSHAGGL